MRLDNISHLGSIKFRVCMEHLWHDFISTQSFLFFFLFLVLHIYIFFHSFLKCYKSSSSCVYMYNSLFYSRRIIIHGPRTSCLQSRQIHLSFRKEEYLQQRNEERESHFSYSCAVTRHRSSKFCSLHSLEEIRKHHISLFSFRMRIAHLFK